MTDRNISVAGLFGLDPAVFEQQQMERDQARAIQMAQLDPMQAAMASTLPAANMVGRSVGRMLGIQDPQMEENAKLIAVKKKAREIGLQPGTAEGMKGYAQLLQEAGLDDKAMQAAEKAQQLAEQEAKTGKAQNDLTREANFRKELAALGPNPTQEQLAAVAAKYGSADKIMDVQLKSLDKQAQIEAKKAELEARLAQELKLAEQNGALRKELKEMEIQGRKDIAGMVAEMRRSLATQKQEATANKPQSLSATAQKELFEQDDTVAAADNAVAALQKAKEINKRAWGFPGAGIAAKATNILPGKIDSADATIEVDNLVTGQALDQLKAIFGAMPTEGERRVLLDIQGSSNLKPDQREKIWDRAIELANRRKKLAQERASGLREGTYFGGQPTSKTDTTPSVESLLEKYK